MQYQEALDFILGQTDYERMAQWTTATLDLARMEALLGLVGSPHRAVRPIQIAGTKGKGSTAAMVASILEAAGYSVGLFTSPHLLDIRERIRLNGRLIPHAQLAEIAATLRPAVAAVSAKAVWTPPTTFELLTAAAFLYFAQQRAQFQVLETGLGGRLDSTNVVGDPVVQIITSISLDHTAQLGGTLEEIAQEKAGIVKPGAVVVTVPQTAEAMQVIEQSCDEKHATLIKVGRDVTIEMEDPRPGIEALHALEGATRRPFQSFTVNGMFDRYALELPLLGQFQRENAAAAVGAIEAMRYARVAVPRHAILDGMRHVVWPGRLQVVERRPFLVLDGAHNPHSADKLRQALHEWFRYERAIVVLGTSVDKDARSIIAELAHLHPTVIATRARHPRSADPEALALLANELGLSVEIVPDVADALARARALAQPTDLICATGSLFVVGDALAALGKSAEDLYLHTA